MPRPRKSSPSQPESQRKIAIVGSFPEHWAKAPFDLPEWEIWAFCSGNLDNLPRFDKWFELHSEKTWRKYDAIRKGYIDFLAMCKSAVTQANFPQDALVKEFGPYFFKTGQAPWLLAYAITQEPDEIGIWGIEAVGEYTPQRADMQHFIQVARDRGITISVPENCTLLEHRKFYAFG